MEHGARSGDVTPPPPPREVLKQQAKAHAKQVRKERRGERRKRADGEKGAGSAGRTPTGKRAGGIALSIAAGFVLFGEALPDGAMGAYMASLEKLILREDRVFWPGHGGPVADPRRFTRGLLTHRRQRETQILEAITGGVSDPFPDPLAFRLSQPSASRACVRSTVP